MFSTSMKKTGGADHVEEADTIAPKLHPDSTTKECIAFICLAFRSAVHWQHECTSEVDY
jgi:hypothetical protein